MEFKEGIEPSSSAWKADAKPLSYLTYYYPSIGKAPLTARPFRRQTSEVGFEPTNNQPFLVGKTNRKISGVYILKITSKAIRHALESLNTQPITFRFLVQL